MAKQAAARGMAIGLKNSLEILSTVQDVVQFATNEACSRWNQCGEYNSFITTKPVFHVEYYENMSTGDACSRAIPGMFTIMKNWTVDGHGSFCNGETFLSPTTNPW
jgi:hypothetical protein